MKRLLKKSLYLTVAFCLVISCTLISIFAAAPESYSTEKNSGERDELCTTFDGTSALDYYTGKYTYENLSTLSESQLLTSLRTLMTDTHSKITSYDECRDLASITDCENENGSIVTIYSSYSASVDDYQKGQGWNREHVWPQSLGGFGTSGGGADLHHVRPSESVINSTRNNNKYGETTGKNVIGNLSGESGGTYGNNLYEPLDNVKGDVARICLYVYVRWGGVSSYTCDDLTVVFTDIDTLLHWCEIDPVDTWEMGRNEVVESIQGNRNVFIDYPELAWLMLGEEVPENMSTPSGKANGGNNGSGESCDHNDTTLVDKKDATCTENGYTGDIKCNNCKEIVTKGTVIYADGHIYGEVTVTKNPTETEVGESFKTCGTCGLKVTIVIPPTSASKLVEIVSNNVYYKDTLNLMYAVRATEGYDVAVKIYDADNKLVETITKYTTENVNGEMLMTFTSLVGVPMQDIDTEFYAVAELSNDGSVVTISTTKRYSVLEYLYERLSVSKNVTEAQKNMYKRLITYANSADIVLNKTSAENSIGNYSYVRVENGTVDGTYSTAIVKSGASLASVTAFDDIVGSGEPVSWKIVSHDFEKTPSTITASDASIKSGEFAVSGGRAYILTATTETVEVVERTETLNIYASEGNLSNKVITWGGDAVTVSNAQSSSTTAIRVSDTDHYRVYKSSVLTISVGSGAIKTVVIKCTSSDYAKALASSLTTEGATATASSTTVTVTVTADKIDTLSFTMTAQSRISSVAVTYVE